MIAMIDRSLPETISASSAPTPAEGSVGQDRDRMDEALVQNAEHDVHGDDRREDQPQLVGERGAEGERRALEIDLHADGQCCSSVFTVSIGLPRRPQRRAGGEVERHRRRGKLADVIDRERRRLLDDARNRAQRHLLRRLARERSTVTYRSLSAAGPALELRLDLEHDAILVRLGEDRRHQALPERVVQRVVDRRRRDSEPARGGAVELDVRLQPAVGEDRWRRRRAPARASIGRRACAPRCRAPSRRHASTVNWYCVRLTRASIVRSCTGCMYSEMPSTCGELSAAGGG